MIFRKNKSRKNKLIQRIADLKMKVEASERNMNEYLYDAKKIKKESDCHSDSFLQTKYLINKVSIQYLQILAP